MDIRFSYHNTHLENPDSFHKTDPHLKRLDSLKLVYRYSLLDSLPVSEPGIYSISGGRQIGKTTLLKREDSINGVKGGTVQLEKRAAEQYQEERFNNLSI